MTLKELSQLYWLRREIERDKKRLAELEASAYSVGSPNLTGMPGGGSTETGGPVERNALAIADLKRLIEQKLDRCVQERVRLEQYISGIPDSLTRQIFTLRFVDGKSWRAVAHGVGGYNTADSARMICNRYIDKENEKERG
jgi:hypothetical protein